ncbi:MAG: YibE/F family protein [Patescibacteria group bacterium]|nr:YibE/F family protein [Patescibacteria group bacterium]
MNKRKNNKRLFLIPIFLLLVFWAAMPASAQEEMFKARVQEVVEQRELDDNLSQVLIQQNLRLEILEGSLKGQEVIFEGIGDLHVLSSNVYKNGDKVIVSYHLDSEGRENFYVLGYDRSRPMFYLALIFVLAVLATGRLKGLRSLIALVASFLVILKFIIPQILSGANPILISVIGGIAILFFAIYLTQGFSPKAHIANLSLSLALLFSAFLSLFFTKAAKLSGYAGEETIYLLDLGAGSINLEGLLLAGILIGTLGVLDDVIVSQISAVEQIKKANPNLSKRQVYGMSFKVGIDHITSMINTLFFAYAGASLPLLILFVNSDILGLNFVQAINNEIIATEIVRTLLGSVGIIFSIPIANYLASYFLPVKKET